MATVALALLFASMVFEYRMASQQRTRDENKHFSFSLCRVFCCSFLLLVSHASVEKAKWFTWTQLVLCFCQRWKKKIRVRAAAAEKKLHTHTAYYLQTLLFNSQSLSNSGCKAFSHILPFFAVSSCVPLFISNRFVHFNMKIVYCCCEHTLWIPQITEKFNQTVCCTHGWMWIVSQ